MHPYSIVREGSYYSFGVDKIDGSDKMIDLMILLKKEKAFDCESF